MSKSSALRAVPFSEQVSAVSPVNGDAFDDTVPDRVRVPQNEMKYLPVSKLDPDPDNPRHGNLGDIDAMAETMRHLGVLQALTVAPHPAKAGRYLVKAGHRRLAAAIVAELETVPCIISQTIIGLGTTMQTMMVENMHRLDLNPMDIAQGMGKLRKELEWSNRQIAEAVSLHDSSVSGYLALLEASEDTQERVAKRELSMTDVVKAVRAQRARKRRSHGHSDQRKVMALTWEPDHFTQYHALSRKAQILCDGREHNSRRRLGKSTGFKGACGGCWEEVIRDDQTKVVTAKIRAELEAERQPA